MSNVPLMFQPLVKYAEFQGRARRSEFWLWILFVYILGTAAGILMMCFMAPGLASLHDTSDMADVHRLIFMRLMPFFGLIGLVHLGLLIPTLAVTVRRLHDTNRSGWWIILPHVVAFIGAIVFMVIFGSSLFDFIARSEKAALSDAEVAQFIFRSLGTAMLTIYLPTFIAWVTLLVFYFSEGTRGPNRFGDDPKARGEARPSMPISIADVPEEMH